MSAPARQRRARQPWAAIVVIAIVLLGTLAPLYWLVSSALKPDTEVASIPATLWPHTITFDNFIEVWQDGAIPAATGRSLLIALATTVCVVVLGSLSAYAATHLRYRFGSHLLTLSFVTQLLPQAATRRSPEESEALQKAMQ